MRDQLQNDFALICGECGTVTLFSGATGHGLACARCKAGLERKPALEPQVVARPAAASGYRLLPFERMIDRLMLS